MSISLLASISFMPNLPIFVQECRSVIWNLEKSHKRPIISLFLVHQYLQECEGAVVVVELVGQGWDTGVVGQRMQKIRCMPHFVKCEVKVTTVRWYDLRLENKIQVCHNKLVLLH